MRVVAIACALVLLATAAPAGASRRVIAVPRSGDTDPLASARAACAQPTSTACGEAKDALSEQLASDLMVVASGRDRRHHDIVRQAADVPYPRVRAAAAAALGALTPGPADTDTLKRLLNDPAPAVRHAALRALGRSTDPARRLVVDRAQDTPRKPVADDVAFTEEAAPTEQRLGAPVYPRATYVHFASDVAAGRAAFVTDDAADAVVRFYAGRATRPAMSATEFEQALAMASARNTKDQQAMMAQANEMMKKMEEMQKAGRSPQEMAAELQKLAPKQAATPRDAIRPYSRTELYGSPRFLLLSKPEDTRALRYAVVFQDLALGKTGIVLHMPPEL
ncbi:MAG TPA: HEAT repeat domain-containing protein [Methylomirabilota bacterium]